MWREVLKGKNVTRGKSNDGLRIGGTGKLAESLQQRDEVFHAAIIGTHQNQRPVCRFCSKTSSSALAVGVNPETLIRPVPSFRWEATRAKAGNFSTSVKRSRTNGRTIAFLF